jgi:hypothetical protein
MQLDFLQQLEEARMTRNDQSVKVLTYADCCERLYLTLLILELLKNFPNATSVVRDYARKTIDVKYERFKMNSTDLYNFIYFVTGDERALGKLKDPGAAMRSRQSTTLPLDALKAYLRSISSGSTPNPTQLFVRLENVLNVSNTDYKTIRRNVTNWTQLTNDKRRVIVTKLLYATRAKLRSSDIIDDLEKFASQRDLESNWVKDNEPTISMPDMSAASRDYVFYRYLVGPENIMLVKGFLQLMAEGKPIPSNMVRAMRPAVKALDDIVRAGPAYISMFRSIQNRAKKTLK